MKPYKRVFARHTALQILAIDSLLLWFSLAGRAQAGKPVPLRKQAIYRLKPLLHPCLTRKPCAFMAPPITKHYTRSDIDYTGNNPHQGAQNESMFQKTVTLILQGAGS
jgi:hypothetical protein